MITTETEDAQSHAATVKLLGDLMPGMPAPARSRAAWGVARKGIDLEAAVRAEGYDLHGAAAREAAPVRTTAPAVPVTPAAPAAAATPSDLTALASAAHLMEVGRLRGTVSAPSADAIKQAASTKIDEAAKELQARNPSLSYRDAVTMVTSGRR